MVCTKDTEIDLLRERVKEYRELLEIGYHIMRDPAAIPTETYEKYLTKLQDHGIGETEEKGWHKKDWGKGNA